MIFRFGIVVLLGLSLTNSGCFRQAVDKGVVFRAILPGEPQTLDWNLAVDSSSLFILDNLVKTLMTYRMEGERVVLVPHLLSKVSAQDDSKVWFLEVDPHARWSDGTPIEARHIYDSFKRLRSPETASRQASQYLMIRGAQNYLKGEEKDFAKVGIRRVDEKTLRIELDFSYPRFPHLLTKPCVAPIRLDLVNSMPQDWLEPQHLVTSGAYRLRGKTSKGLDLVRVKPSASPKTVNAVSVLYVDDPSVATQLYETNQVDFVPLLVPEDAEKLKKMPGYFSSPLYMIVYLGFNIPDVKWRQALSWAIDRQQLVDLLKGGREINSTFLPGGLAQDLQAGSIEFSVKKAKKLKKSLQIPAEKPLELWVHAGLQTKLLAENIQYQLKKNLDLKIEIKTLDWVQFLGKINNENPDMFRMAWAATYLDAADFLSHWTSLSLQNRVKWKNKAYDALLEEILRLPDGRARNEKIVKAVGEIQKDLPILPLYQDVKQQLIRPSFEGFPRLPLHRYDLSELRVAP